MRGKNMEGGGGPSFYGFPVGERGRWGAARASGLQKGAVHALPILEASRQLSGGVFCDAPYVRRLRFLTNSGGM